MDYRLLGRTGLRVSPLCLGTMNFGMGKVGGGVQTEEDDGHRIMDRGLDLGINFFDTANVYGDGRGLTEQIIGRWFAQGDRRRERTVLATKVYNARDSWPNSGRLSALHIRQACEDSLRAPADRLHRPLPDAPRRPRHAVGRDLAGDGPARAAGQGALRRAAATSPAGTSCRPTRRPRAAARSASCRSRASTTSTPARSSSRCCPRASTTASAMIPWSPLGGGLLGGVLADRAAGGRRGDQSVQDRIEEHAPAARSVGEVLRRARPRAGRRRAGVAARTTRSSPRRSSARARSSSSTARMGALDVRARRRRARTRSTRSSPARAAPRPKRTPGDRRMVTDTW